MQKSGFVAVAEDAIRRSQGHETPSPPVDAVCPRCNGNGLVRKPIQVGGKHIEQEVVPCPDCTPKPTKEQRLKGITNAKTFDDFRPSPATRPAIDGCRDLLEGRRWVLLLRGGTGCGKTHLAQAACLQWAEHDLAVFVSVADYLGRLKDTFDGEERSETVFQWYANAPFLALDDLGSSLGTDWQKTELFRLIDYRYQRQLPTIVTTNSPDEKLESRTISRLRPGQVYIRAQDQRNRYEGRR